LNVESLYVSRSGSPITKTLIIIYSFINNVYLQINKGINLKQTNIKITSIP